jgi:hypothetical protein
MAKFLECMPVLLPFVETLAKCLIKYSRVLKLEEILHKLFISINV